MAIQFEDTVIGSYERLFPVQSRNSQSEEKGATAATGIDGVSWKTVLGYLWVVSWFWFSLGWGGDANLKSGLFTIRPAKISIVGPLLRQYEETVRWPINDSGMERGVCLPWEFNNTSYQQEILDLI